MSLYGPTEPLRPSPLGAYNPVPFGDLSSIQFQDLTPGQFANTSSPWASGTQTTSYQGQDIPTQLYYSASDASGPGFQATTFNFNPATGAYDPATQQGSANQPSLGYNILGDVATAAGLAIAGGGPTGLLGDASAGPGAAAVGGSAAADLGATSFTDPALYDALVSANAASGGASSLAGSEQAAQGLTMLPATGASSPAALDPVLAQQLGVDLSTLGTTLTPGAGSLAGGSAPDWFAAAASGAAPSATEGAVTDALATTAGAGGGGGFLDSVGSWLSSPKNLASLGLGGLSLVNSLSKPKLPSQLGPATAANTSASNAANSVITGGGTASPNWAQQKSSIDATIAQELQQQSEALQQNAANSGQQGMVVQQQLNQLKQTLETQRQTLYEQAQRDNVNQAIAELTGSNQALLGISQLQMQQDQQAQAASNQLAELALLLTSKG